MIARASATSRVRAQAIRTVRVGRSRAAAQPSTSPSGCRPVSVTPAVQRSEPVPGRDVQTGARRRSRPSSCAAVVRERRSRMAATSRSVTSPCDEQAAPGPAQLPARRPVADGHGDSSPARSSAATAVTPRSTDERAAWSSAMAPGRGGLWTTGRRLRAVDGAGIRGWGSGTVRLGGDLRRGRTVTATPIRPSRTSAGEHRVPSPVHLRVRHRGSPGQDRRPDQRRDPRRAARARTRTAGSPSRR